MKLRFLMACLALSALSAVVNPAQAIGREDVLECGLPDDSKFVLRSKYDYSLIPVPLVHSSRISNRGSWIAEYVDTEGKSSQTPAWSSYSGHSNPEILRRACSYFGMLNGVVLATYTYLRRDDSWDNSWMSLNHFQRERLSVIVQKETVLTKGQVNSVDRLTQPVRATMDKAGISGSTVQFGFIAPKDGRLFSEQPLYNKSLKKMSGDFAYYDIIFAAVYQSFSTDDGKTWSDPIVTTDAKIFEIGKSWLEQSFIARPISLNGKPIKTE